MLDKTKNNISVIWNKFTEVLGNLPLYSKAQVSNIDRCRILVINDKSYKITTDDEISIIDGNKTIHVTGDMNIETVGNILINNKKGNLEGLISEKKLKAYLATVVGNFGAPIHTAIQSADLTYDTIKIGEES